MPRHKVRQKAPEPRGVRMRQRMRARLHRSRRHLAIAGLVTVALGLIGARLTTGEPLRELVLEGEFERMSLSQLRAQLAGYAELPLHEIDLAAVRSEIAALPWVAEVSVWRQWPDRLGVSVVEREPLAAWESPAGDKGFVSTTDEAVLLDGFAANGLPTLRASRADIAKVAEAWRQWSPMFAKEDLPLAGISLDLHAGWQLTTQDGVPLRYGQALDPDRADWLFTVRRQRLTKAWGDVAYVDLRYRNGFAVGWR